MKRSHTRARRMEPILATLTALIVEVEKVKQPSAFVHVLRGSLVTARDNATWEIERLAGPASSPARPASHAARTLLLSAPGRAGVLVESRGATMHEQPMPFTDAHAALSWCEAEGVTLIYTPSVPTPESN